MLSWTLKFPVLVVISCLMGFKTMVGVVISVAKIVSFVLLLLLLISLASVDRTRTGVFS